MNIIELVNFDLVCSENNSFVLRATAVIEDAKLIREHNWIEPPEYGPALCRTEVSLYDEDLTDNDFSNEQGIVQFLEQKDPDWILNEDDRS